MRELPGVEARQQGGDQRRVVTGEPTELQGQVQPIGVPVELAGHALWYAGAVQVGGVQPGADLRFGNRRGEDARQGGGDHSVQIGGIGRRGLEFPGAQGRHELHRSVRRGDGPGLGRGDQRSRHFRGGPLGQGGQIGGQAAGEQPEEPIGRQPGSLFVSRGQGGVFDVLRGVASGAGEVGEVVVLRDLGEPHPVEVRADGGEQGLVAARSAARQPQVDILSGLSDGPHGMDRLPLQGGADHQFRGGVRQRAIQAVRAPIIGVRLPHWLRGAQPSRRHRDSGTRDGCAVFAEHSALDGHGTGDDCTGHGFTW